MRNVNPGVKVFDFFSGCGGASCGFRAAGMEIVYALDRDSDSARTFQINFPSSYFERKDIQEASVDTVRRLIDDLRPAPVLFCGCAPCQPFTKQNTTRPEPDKDDRITLLSHFSRFIEECNPDIVFVENVPGLQRPNGSQPFASFLDTLEAYGYQSKYDVVPLMRYGVPQSRRRLMLLASRHGPIELPPKTHGPGTDNPRYQTVKDWIGELPPIAAGESHPQVSDHRAASLSQRNLERIRATPEGGGHRGWPRHLKLPCHEKSGGYSDVYGRMSWDRPAAGLTTRCISYSNGRFGHPEQDRAISLREAASLQTFPLDFVFTGGFGSMARQIGNAVPVRVTQVIGNHVNGHLRDVEVLA